MQANQVQPVGAWPSGDEKTIAVLNLSLAEMTNRYGLVFAREFNDLGPYDFSAIELEPGVQVWFVKDDPDSHPGMSVHVDAGADAGKTLSRVLVVLELDRDSVIWAAGSAAGRRVLA